MTTNPLLISVRSASLPEDREEIRQRVQEIKSALEEVLLSYNVDPSRIKPFDGDVYSQIEANCPDCGEPLTLTEFDLGPENGRDSRATCECGYEGRAVYRLVDLEDNLETSTIEA